MFTKRIFVFITILSLAGLGQTAFSHHSMAMFDLDGVKELKGTIKEFQFTNPHSWIQMLVEGEDNAEIEWSLEWGSPNGLARQGVRPSTFQEGDNVTIRIHPMLDGSTAGSFIGAKLEDGNIIGRWQD